MKDDGNTWIHTSYKKNIDYFKGYMLPLSNINQNSIYYTNNRFFSVLSNYSWTLIHILRTFD